MQRKIPWTDRGKTVYYPPPVERGYNYKKIYQSKKQQK